MAKSRTDAIGRSLGVRLGMVIGTQMRNEICHRLGIDFPLLGFSHCRDVVAAVSRSGGFGVLGAALFNPDELERELAWIDAHSHGHPYGVDLIIPSGAMAGSSDIPIEAKAFVDDMLIRYGIDPGSVDEAPVATAESMSADMAAQMIEVAFRHPVRLIANALGVPPPHMIERCKAQNVLIAALAGSPVHAVRQVRAGVDVVVAAGYEAGGHTGEIGTMVLVPEVIEAVEQVRQVPVLAAGGIVKGRQIAAALALGAAGVWTGSVWLTTEEAETAPYTKEKMLLASSGDTVRSRARTGKPSRQLRSAWHAEWDRPESPKPLPMPLMGQLCDPVLKRVDVLAQAGHQGARELSTYWVGQGVGLMKSARPVRQVVAEMMEDCVWAVEQVGMLHDD